MEGHDRTQVITAMSGERKPTTVVITTGDNRHITLNQASRILQVIYPCELFDPRDVKVETI